MTPNFPKKFASMIGRKLSIREHSRVRIVCVAIGWILAAIIAWLSLTPSPPQIDIEQGDKLGHLAAYGTLMFWFCLLYKRRATRIAYAILWIAMGVGLEFIQSLPGTK